MDSSLVLHQYVQQLARKQPTVVEAFLEVPDGYEETVWQTENLRQGQKLAMLANSLFTSNFLGLILFLFYCLTLHSPYMSW